LFAKYDQKGKGHQKINSQLLGTITQGVDPTKLFFFANEEFFHFSLVNLRIRNIQKKIIYSKMT